MKMRRDGYVHVSICLLLAIPMAVCIRQTTVELTRNQWRDPGVYQPVHIPFTANNMTHAHGYDFRIRPMHLVVAAMALKHVPGRRIWKREAVQVVVGYADVLLSAVGWWL
jgi:hypothetical protein